MCPLCNSEINFKLKTEKYKYDIYSCVNKNCNHFFYKDFYPGQGVDQREENVDVTWCFTHSGQHSEINMFHF